MVCWRKEDSAPYRLSEDPIKKKPRQDPINEYTKKDLITEDIKKNLITERDLERTLLLGNPRRTLSGMTTLGDASL